LIRVAIAGSPGMLRAGLEAVVRERLELQLIGTFELTDDVPVVDVLLVLGTLDVESPRTPVVLILAGSEPVNVRAALRSGVRSALPVSATAVEIFAAIQAAAAGLTAFRPSDLEERTTETSQLSPRELEVLRMLADGLANKEIAWRLGISEHTVKFHVTSILNRLNAASRAEAVAIGMRNGWITI